MQNRQSNNKDNNNENFRQSLISATAAITGVLNGMHAGSNVFFPKPPIPYALATAFVIGLGFYGVKRVNSNLNDNNEDLNSKSKDQSQAAVAAAASGTSSLAGWTAMRYFGDKRLFTPNFTGPMLYRSLGATVVGGGILGFGLPVLINKGQNEYQKLNGNNFNEKASFLLFRHLKRLPIPTDKQKEEKEITDVSAFRR